MGDIIFFTVGTLGFLFLVMLAVFKWSVPAIYHYLKDNLGVTKGIVVFTGGFILIAAISILAPKVFADEKMFTYFNYGEIYVGLDYSKKLSPQCEEGGINDRWASNGGGRLNLLRTVSQRAEINGYYLHKSCAFNEDREGIDSFGVEMTFRLWGE